MEARELRIGNYIKAPFYDNYIEVHSICSITEDIYNRTTGEIPLTVAKPIPLTEDVFNKIGIKKEISGDFIIRYNGQNIEWNDGQLILEGSYGAANTNQCFITKEIKFLHEYQNTIYDLTGIELSFNVEA